MNILIDYHLEMIKGPMHVHAQAPSVSFFLRMSMTIK